MCYAVYFKNYYDNKIMKISCLKLILVFSFLLITTSVKADIADDVEILLNKIRLENKKHPLKQSNDLTVAAQAHAEVMVPKHISM